MQVRGSTTQRQGSSVTSLSDTSSTRVPYPTESENYNIGTRLDWKTNESNTLWLDLDSARQRYDNDDGQLGNLTGVTIKRCAMSVTKSPSATIPP